MHKNVILVLHLFNGREGKEGEQRSEQTLQTVAHEPRGDGQAVPVALQGMLT